MNVFILQAIPSRILDAIAAALNVPRRPLFNAFTVRPLRGTMSDSICVNDTRI